MNGAIIGDIVGSVYEFHTIKQKEFKFLKPKCFFTDDSVLTCAVANASMKYLENPSIEDFQNTVRSEMKRLTKQFPKAGFGWSFQEWAFSDQEAAYGSYGNGGAMRTAPVAYVAKTLEEALELAKAQAEVTHSHPEGIKGAQAIAACVFLARTGATKDEIREYVQEHFYPLDFTISEIYKKYHYDITAQGSVPQAIESFLEGRDFEDSIRNAICLGGDADTLAAMAGSIAEAYYGISEEYQSHIEEYLDPDLNQIRKQFYQAIQPKDIHTEHQIQN